MTAKTSKHVALGALLATPILAAAANASAATPADQISPDATARLSAGLLAMSPSDKLAVAGGHARAPVVRPIVIQNASGHPRSCTMQGPALTGLRATPREVNAVVLPCGETLRVSD